MIRALIAIGLLCFLFFLVGYYFGMKEAQNAYKPANGQPQDTNNYYVGRF